ncbi:MAG: hypothetical protein CGW95_01045 [Phenylobacterium zucineum]|nr:MAG: hypothetical protein CGW95_01045 [Phenylobacterium zucineum]
MSAYLNSLWEEGTVEDLRIRVKKLRDELGDSTPVDETWDRRTLFNELVKLFNQSRPKVTRELETK